MIEFVIILHVDHRPEIEEARDIATAIRHHKSVLDASLVRRSENAIVLTGHFRSLRRWQRPVSRRDQMLSALRTWRPIPVRALDVLVRGAHEMDPAVSVQRHHLVSDLSCLGIRV